MNYALDSLYLLHRNGNFQLILYAFLCTEEAHHSSDTKPGSAKRLQKNKLYFQKHATGPWECFSSFQSPSICNWHLIYGCKHLLITQNKDKLIPALVGRLQKRIHIEIHIISKYWKLLLKGTKEPVTIEELNILSPAADREGH